VIPQHREFLILVFGRVQALALFAVDKLFFTFLAATVTTVIFTTAVVVLVIAVTITFVVRLFASSIAFLCIFICLVSRIQTVAFGAVRKLEFIVGLPAAITIVPIAAAVVVSIIATSISVVCRLSAFIDLRALLFRFLGIFALTFRAIRKLILVAAFATAVTTIPATATVVVPIVAAPITFPPFGLAGPGTTVLGTLFGVQTFALFTIVKLFRVATFAAAITAVPVASAVVVLVIASFIADVILGATMTALWTTFLLFCWVKASALFAVVELTFVARSPATVTLVPITGAVVVLVVTPTVTHP